MYRCIEEPSNDFYCPVVYNLLVKPHLTSCCGKHLSPEAVTRLVDESKPCPLCKEMPWDTMLNKDFQRQVHALKVKCLYYDDKKCEWKGELSSFNRHVESSHVKTPLNR